MSSTTISVLGWHHQASPQLAPETPVLDGKPDSRPAPSGMRKAPRKEAKQIKIGALEGHLGYYIRRLQVWVFQDFIRSLAPLEIRPAQYSVLTVIGANPGLSQ